MYEQDGFSFMIKNTNDEVEDNVTQVDFSNCEKILREKNNLSDSYNLSILQINTKSSDERVLTDTVQYKIYDEDGNEMDLSVCNNVKIKINYVINDNDILDMTKLSKFKDMDVDIINIEDDFFNDICYSYSNSSDDMILTDRIKDIYQNVSVCDNGCEYDSIDVNSSTVSCNCDVQENVTDDTESRSYTTSITSAFLDANFGVVKCYNLVFSPKNKIKNIGFWIMTILLVAQVPFLILYILKGLMPVLEFVQETMYRNGYLSNKNELYDFMKTNNKENKEKIDGQNNEKSNNIEQIQIQTENLNKNHNKKRIIKKGHVKRPMKRNSVNQNFETPFGNPPPRFKTNAESFESGENVLFGKTKNSKKSEKFSKSTINQIEINNHNKKTEDEKEYEIDTNKNNNNNIKNEIQDDIISIGSKGKMKVVKR